MSTLLLTEEEICDLTKRVHHSSQVKVLRSMGIEHRARPDGSLAVSRSHVEQILGVAITTKKQRPEVEPDWSGINAARA